MPTTLLSLPSPLIGLLGNRSLSSLVASGESALRCSGCLASPSRSARVDKGEGRTPPGEAADEEQDEASEATVLWKYGLAKAATRGRTTDRASEEDCGAAGSVCPAAAAALEGGMVASGVGGRTAASGPDLEEAGEEESEEDGAETDPESEFGGESPSSLVVW